MTSGDTAGILAEVAAARKRGPPAVLATVIQSPPDAKALVGAKLLVRHDGSTLGSLGGGPLEAAVIDDAREALRAHGVQTRYYASNGARLTRAAAEAGAFHVMLEVHEPPATLLIAGGGHIGNALATIGELCGFSVAVVDDRPEYASAERFPGADRVLCGRFEEVLRDFPVDPNTYVVVVTRGHKSDEVALRQVVSSPAAYVGMIGSRRRVGAVLKHLVEDGADPDAVSRVHTPIGLDIGAETPEEIAVSIMAELIQVRRGGTGDPMRGGSRAGGGTQARRLRPPPD